MSRRRAGSVLVSLTLLIHSLPLSAQRAVVGTCDVVTNLRAVPDLPEGSGLAVSRRLPRRLFTVNDSGTPEVLVLNVDGTPRGKVAIKGADVFDWEDITAGPCAAGSCLYVGDIGDNNAIRPHISVYRILEPRDGEQQATATRFDAVFPDGARDAEALFTGPDGQLLLLTKEARGAGLYAFPARLSAEVPNRLERVRTLDFGTGRGRLARVTDAESSSDGRTMAVRTNDTLFVVPTASLLAGRLSDAAVFSLRQLREPQGEGVALGSMGEVFLVGEGGGRRATGTFAALSCMAP